MAEAIFFDENLAQTGHAVVYSKFLLVLIDLKKVGRRNMHIDLLHADRFIDMVMPAEHVDRMTVFYQNIKYGVAIV